MTASVDRAMQPPKAKKIEYGYTLNRAPRFFFALFYCLIVVSVPWEAFLGYEFPDKQNYIARFEFLEFYGPESINPNGGLLGAFVSEALWGYILYWFGEYGFSSEVSLLFISFFSLYAIVMFVTSKVNPLVAAVLLINPLVIDLVMAQQRSALTYAAFLLFISTARYWLKLGILASALFVHVASVLLFAGYFFSLVLERLKFANNPFVNRMAHFLTALIAAAVILMAKDVVLGAIGDRRAAGPEGAQSLLYAFFWAALACYIVLFGKVRSDWMSNFGLLFALLFLVAVLLNMYSSRYLVFALPFLIVALTRVPIREAMVGCGLLFLYQCLQWVYWSGVLTR
jgi:hypothetical protein